MDSRSLDRAGPPAADPGLIDRALGIVEEIFGDVRPRNFAVRLWDGSLWGAGGATVTLVFHHPGALRRMFLRPSESAFARAYIRGDIDIEGDFERVAHIAQDLLNRPPSLRERLHLGLRLLQLPDTPGPLAGEPEPGGDDVDGHDPRRPRLAGRTHTSTRDRQAVRHHYDVSNDFYRLWLDERMIYSCACFVEGDDDLDRAQLRKLDLICRKLRLRPGMRLLDIGCGWGGLLLHAAEQYGVEGLGITLSQPQADEANARFAAAGLEGRCRAQVLDYRELQTPEPFDRIVSVGMVEHVGSERLAEYLSTAFRLLREEGAFLLHGIGDLPGRPQKKEEGFVRTYVFPDSDLPPLSRVLAEAEQQNFEVRDVESLRENYARTLRHWAGRLEAQRERAVDEVGETTFRTWRLYLRACAWWFERGYISVYQSLLVRRSAAGAAGVPLSRFDWYEELAPVRARPSSGSLAS